VDDPFARRGDRICRLLRAAPTVGVISFPLEDMAALRSCLFLRRAESFL
jgi:hypothetical protein